MPKTAIVVLLALLPLGCSFYYSSESSVKSSTSPCRSSGSSEDEDKDKDQDKKEAYRDDVRDYTAAYAAESEDLDGFTSGLAAVARRHGITDWEAEDATYAAIGAGLKHANARTADLARYESALAHGDPNRIALL